MFRVTGLNIFSRVGTHILLLLLFLFWEKYILLYILKGILPFKMHLIIFFQKTLKKSRFHQYIEIGLFDFTTAGDWDCMAAVERLPALHYSVDSFSCPLGSWVLLLNFETIRGSLMKPKWQKLASLAKEICTL